MIKGSNDIHTTGIAVQNGDLFVRRTQDVEPIIDANKDKQQVAPKFAETFRHVASIPLVVIEKWIMEEGAPVLEMSKDEFARFVKKKLNDPDNKYLKSFNGRV